MRIAARVAAPGASCPDCGTWSERVHGSYLRSPSGLPSYGRPVTVALRVRRFACPAPAWRRRTFVEQVDGLTRRHGQVTERQRSSVAGLGLAPAGRAGAGCCDGCWSCPIRPSVPRRRSGSTTSHCARAGPAGR
ncbi:transposase family protein [Kitasatospora sp. NPDC056184]|uniref:transposase family protein n=1 Tax=Kitasatospora sp. NPDC056184 TaxID=3345738 RepID=UPI0035DF298F